PAKRYVGQLGQLSREACQVRIGHEDPLLPAMRQLRCNRDRRALPQVVDVRLVGQPEAGDDWSLEPFGALCDRRDDESWLAVVDLARGADQARPFGRGGDDEPGIDSNAMSADTRSWLQDRNPGVAVGEFDDLPHIEAELIADQRQLIGKSNIDVA